jgi:hypothetical protein
VASSSSRAGEYPRLAWMEWDGMERILSLCWLVLFFFSIRIQAFPSLDSSRRGFRLLRGAVAIWVRGFRLVVPLKSRDQSSQGAVTFYFSGWQRCIV